MRHSSFSLPTAAAALLTATLLAASTVAAQAPQAAPAGQAGGPPAGTRPPEPAPTNLKVLPKDMTGEQVHELMHKWEAALGAHCSTCHTADPKNIGPNGRPRLNYADDTKEEKLTARLMYKMTEDINVNYVSKVPSSDEPVTCGTCHRGHLGPEPWVAPKEEHDHDHDHDHAAPPPPAAPKP